MRPSLPILLLLLLAAAGCAQGGTAMESTDDAGDNIRVEGPGGDGVVPSDMGSGESHDVAAPDIASECPDDGCTIGERSCEGVGVVVCEEDPLNPTCGVWSAPADCVSPQTCVAGSCETPVGCVDNDADGYGVMCASGEDCDDANAAVNSGAPEVCDGVDNDCNGTIDDGFQLGMACSYGTGVCQADGVLECDATGGVVCSAMAVVGDPEVCDGVDNDCNGIIDDGVCAACQADVFEPNDLPADAELVQVDQPKWGYTCPGDTDWFELETQTGVEYHIYVTFPEERSDLLVQGWVDGVNVVTGDTTGRDYEEFIVNGDAAKTFQIEVIDRDSVESFFRISLVTDANCVYEDGFVPNQSMDEAAQFPAGWLTEAYMCSGGLSDWYSMGDLVQGDDLYIGVIGESFGTDLDLHVWGDPQGDGTFEQMMSAATFDNVEEIDTTVPHTGQFYFEVRDFDGYGGYYDVGWTSP